MTVETAFEYGYPVGWGAPTYKLLLDDWKSLTNILAPVIQRKNAQERRIELISGGDIEFFSLDNPDAIRGKKYRLFIVNEAAFVPNLVDIWNLVIRPTLIDYEGFADFAGTPKGMNGFYQLFNHRGPDWAQFQMSSFENPHIPKVELEQLKTTMTERAYQQEILAQFLEDGGGVFRNVRECAILEQEQPQKNKEYVIGVDWGRTNDATVFMVLELGTNKVRRMDRMTDTDYALQRQRLIVLSNSYNNATIMAEANSIGQPQIEALQAKNIPIQGFTTTNATKAQIIQSLELAFEQKKIEILNDEVLINELLSFESQKLPSGLIRYAGPDGVHDDCVIALALAYYAATGGASWYMW